MDEINRKQIIDSFIRVLNHISDKSYQRRAWIKGEAADFDEAVCVFFSIVDPVLEDRASFKLTPEQFAVLKKFRDNFESFSDENDHPEEFIDTPEWAKITEGAKEVLKAFKRN